MHVYKCEATILGNNDKPQLHVERVIASGWQDAFEIMAAIARDTGCVITGVNITQTQDRPFDYKAEVKPQ